MLFYPVRPSLKRQRPPSRQRSGCLVRRRSSACRGSRADKNLKVIRCQASGCGFVDSPRYLLCSIAVSTILRIGRHAPLGIKQDLLSGFTDSDWGNRSSRLSTSCNLMLHNQAPIMWRSKMQKTTALPTRSTTQHRRRGVVFYISARSVVKGLRTTS